ncbi:MAG: MarR family transcriptional regulator [Acidobacteria bacterium]|nr:MarR family transcriptional regulator [Acidobacteriota bacterium]
MTTMLLTEKYADQLDGVLHCYDRVVLTGSLMPLCYAQGMTQYLYTHDIRIFDYPQFAQPFAQALRENAEALAAEHGLTIEYIRKKTFRKEARIEAILQKRGRHPGLVHIFSALEPCASYKPWHDKTSHKTYLKSEDAKCLHYYFYFIDEELGLCYLRVPTWCPFRLQVYFNGHAWLARQLKRKGVAFELQDNAFVHIADYAVANQLAAHFDWAALHRRLDAFAERYCPVVKSLSLSYHWSIWQVEYATDLVFKQRRDVQALFPPLLEALVLSVKPEDIATFLGQKLHGNYQGEVGNRLQKRFPGTRIKHTYGPVTLKLYDKFGLILRIETTVNDVAFFQQYRVVQHRTGERETKWAPMKKTLYNLTTLQDLLQAANRRYLEFLSALDTPIGGGPQLSRLTASQTENGHHYKGFNFFADDDVAVFRALLRGEFAISGLTRRALHTVLSHHTPGQLSRLLKRLRVHGLLKKVGRRYKYYLTALGRQVATLVLRLRELYAVPALASPAHA